MNKTLNPKQIQSNLPNATQFNLTNLKIREQLDGNK